MLLALDTCLDACAVVLAADGELRASRTREMRRGHAEALLPMVASLLAEAGCKPRQVSRIAVTTGPGSFTGVRVGVAAARGLALALRVPAAGFSTLAALAAAARAHAGARFVLAAIAARRAHVYVQMFDAAGMPHAPPALLALAEAERRFATFAGALTGSGASLLHERMPEAEALIVPAGLAVALVGLAASNAGECPPVPLYLRPPDAVKPTGAALPRRPSG